MDSKGVSWILHFDFGINEIDKLEFEIVCINLKRKLQVNNIYILDVIKEIYSSKKMHAIVRIMFNCFFFS